jgi:hypothetical protein
VVRQGRLEDIPSDFYDSELGALDLVLVIGTVLTALWLAVVVSGIV